MLKPNELRIGNLLQTKSLKEIVRVHWISERGSPFNGPDWRCRQIKDEFGEYVSHQTEPIPITEEWLIKFGFKYRNENIGIGAILDLKEHPENIDVPEWKFHKSVAFVHDKNDEKDTYLTMLAHPTAHKIKYVHQLQNLYFALTGTELTVTNTKPE